MKNFSKIGAALTAFAGIVSFARATGPVGVWHGRVSFDFSKLPPTANSTQEKAMMDRIKAATQVKVTLTLMTDKTFMLFSTGGTVRQPPETGTYTYTATSVTIHPTIKGGRDTAKTLILSKDGKTLTLTQGLGSITFVR